MAHIALANLLRTARAVACVVWVAVSGLYVPGAHAGEKIRVTFINPDKPGNPFWDALTEFMQAAASDLDIDLQVRHAGGGRFSASNLAQEILQSDPKPDYLVYIPQVREIGRTLQAAEAAKVRSFAINTDVLPEDKILVGAPGDKYKYWIGHMFPNDVQAGRDLALVLLRESRAKYPGKTAEVIGVSGSRDSAAAVDRNTGLESAVSQFENTQLNQIVFAGWDPQDAQLRTAGLLKRYPQTRVLWAASDAMALGMVTAARAQGRTPGSDVFIGGVDWSDAGLVAIAQGDLVASMGGHFMEGGWAMVLLHDYHHGRDFSSALGSTIRSEMQVIHKGNVLSYRKSFSGKYADAIDFRKFSRVLNPGLKKYDFSLKAVLNASKQ